MFSTRGFIVAGHGDEVAEDIETLPDGGTVWRATFTYRFPLNRVSAWFEFGGKMFLSYMEKHGKPDLIWAHRLSGPGWLAQELQQRFKNPLFYPRTRYTLSEIQTSFLLATAATAEGRSRCGLLRGSQWTAQECDSTTARHVGNHAGSRP